MNTFLLCVVLVFVIIAAFLLYHFVRRVWGLKGFFITLVVWLVLAYPLAHIIATSYPKDEACGIAGWCVGYLIGFLVGIAWLVIIPIITALVANFKWRQKQVANGLKMTAKNYALEYSVAGFIILCLVIWFVSLSTYFYGH